MLNRARPARAVVTRRERILLILFLGALTALGPFTMDLYLPAFPSVARDFGTTPGVVQLTLTATAIGLGVGQLLVGPWSDRVGRRVPLVLATILHVAASVGIAIAPTIELVALMRFGQGFGAAASGVVAAAMVRDLFGGIQLVRILSRIALINGLAPIAAPLIGSQLLRVFDWRGVFWMLAAYGFVLLVAAVTTIRETLPSAFHISVDRRSIMTNVRAVLGDRVFVGAALVGGMTFASIITYLSISPFLFQGVYGLTVQEFGLLFAAVAVALLIATQAAALLMRYFEPAWLLAVALPVLLLAGAAMIVVDALRIGLLSVAVPCLVLVATCGFCGPCLQVLVLEHHPREAGTAGAITGFLNCVVGGVVSPIPGLLGLVSGSSLGVIVVVAMIVALAALWLVIRPRRVPKLARHPESAMA